MGFPILVRYHLSIESGPRSCYSTVQHSAIWYITHKKMNSLQWRHNERDGVSNHQSHGCLLNRLFKSPIKENIKAPRHWPLCGEFTGHAQRASNVENVSIWWRHHVKTDNTYLAIAGKILWLGVCWGYFRYACWWFNGRFPTFKSMLSS